MTNLNITNLISGGLLTNYYCTSKCKHCLYGCSPTWEKNYISKQTAKSNFKKINQLNCNSIHIGGGEPFLNFDGLKEAIEAANEENINIQYIETNSSWFKDVNDSVEKLKEIKELGISTLLISISPFHNEHIPFYKVKGVMNACKLTGISIMPWIDDFYNEIDSFDDKITHSLDEYTEKFGGNYIQNIPLRYWIHYGGRVIHFYKNFMPLNEIDDIIFSSQRCSELVDTSHFHVDLFNNYIPGLCSGFSIQVEDLGKPLSDEKYPILNMLYNRGINGFYQYAIKNYNYKPTEDKFLNKCHLCFDIRKYLVIEQDLGSPELSPKEYYKNANILKY